MEIINYLNQMEEVNLNEQMIDRLIMENEKLLSMMEIVASNINNLSYNMIPSKNAGDRLSKKSLKIVYRK